MVIINKITSLIIPMIKSYTDYMCQRCRTYLKAINLRHAESETLLPLERVLTADMDRQGQGKGYKGV